ncbi:MAG TPA: PDZ domain-containing protein, partial [Planctomycetota bacterium]|nr:PDZ domain-containing protein [Planctomycetota bacterium]
LESLLDAFSGGGGGGGDRGGESEAPKMPDFSELRKRAEELFGGGGNGETPGGLKDLLDRLRGNGGDDGEKSEPEERPAPAVPPVYLGIIPAPADEAADVSGVRIGTVMKGSPAEAAGLQAGDVIVAIGAAQVAGESDLAAALGRRAPGETIDVKVLRERTVAGVPVYDEKRLEAKLVARAEGK